MAKLNSLIDCSIPCFQFMRMFNSCPTKQINYANPFNPEDIHEIIMVLLSISPYPTSFLILLLGTYFRTTRSLFILMMIFIQNFLVEILKNNLKDPRPNYKCNQHYGNPSNHATFFTCLITWFIMESLTLEKKYKFKYKIVLFALFAVYPFVIYSRLYLKYHSIEQIMTGIILGVVVGVGWFILSVNYLLANDNMIRKMLCKFHVKNTLTNVILINNENFVNNNSNEDQEELQKQYQLLLEKNEQLGKLKNDLKHLTNNVKNMDFMKKRRFDNIMKGNEEKNIEIEKQKRESELEEMEEEEEEEENNSKDKDIGSNLNHQKAEEQD